MNKQDAQTFLKDFINRIDTQDNRSTASPIQFLLQTKRTIWGAELYSSDKIAYGVPENDYYGYESKTDLLKQLKEDGYSDEEIQKMEIDRSEGQDYWHTEQAFFTEEGLNDHIRMNKHNLGEYRSYVVHSFRNPEMKELIQAIRLMVTPDVNLDKVAE